MSPLVRLRAARLAPLAVITSLSLSLSLSVLACDGKSGQEVILPDAAVPDAAACTMLTPPTPCMQDSPLCIEDLRVERSRFLICRTGNAWEPYVTSCGTYDAVVYAGTDSAMTYYFDRGTGHLVGHTSTGLTTLPFCNAYAPSFHPTECDTPDVCPSADAGARLADYDPQGHRGRMHCQTVC